MKRGREPFPVVRPGKGSRPLFTRPSRRTLLFWAVLALLNIIAGIVVSTHPHRITDLESMMRWSGSWLRAGDALYDVADVHVDYPPNAIVLLSPLALLPIRVVIAAWVILNIFFACLAPLLAARFFRPYDSFRALLLPVLMFLTWGGVRTLTQFSLCALTFSMAALLLADRRPTAAGVWLGLAMMKPQVAVPVFLWSVFTRRWRVALSSIAVAGGLWAVFCIRAQVSPLHVLMHYGNVLATYHTRDAILAGLSELRPLIQQQVKGFATVDAIAAVVAFAMLTGICVAGFREGVNRTRVIYAAPALAACWSLLTFYHLTYGFIVLLPAMMLLALDDGETSMLRKTTFWTLQIAMMFDVPGVFRRLGLSGTPVYDNVIVHTDRVIIFGILIGLAVLATRVAGSQRAGVEIQSRTIRAARNS